MPVSSEASENRRFIRGCMSGECEGCHEHCLECRCDDRRNNGNKKTINARVKGHRLTDFALELLAYLVITKGWVPPENDPTTYAIMDFAMWWEEKNKGLYEME